MYDIKKKTPSDKNQETAPSEEQQTNR